MCNQEIKFKLFLDAALKDGADMIATGHYARVKNDVTLASHFDVARIVSIDKQSADTAGKANPRNTDNAAQLWNAVDEAKDQTYFLYRISEKALEKTLFPVGEFTKPEIRKLAADFGLATANKKDSQGICFVGEVGIKEFLSQYVEGKAGDIIDKKTNQVIGQHEGAIFYTIGQRHGLGVGGGLPYYVVEKDMKDNVVYVTTDLNDETLWRDKVKINQLHWINQAPKAGQKLQGRLRYRAALVGCTLTFNDNGATVNLDEPERAIAVGQSVVLYYGHRVVGGGIIHE